MGMTIKELAAKKAKEAAAAAAKNKVVGKDNEEKKEADREKDLNSRFYKALANKDVAELKALSEEFEKDYKAKGQSVGTNADGGYLVPTTLDTQIREKLRVLSPIRQIATVMSNMPADLTLPLEGTLPTTYWVGEGVAPTESKQTFDVAKMKAHKLGGFGKFTYESLADTAVTPSLQSFVADRFALSLAINENAAFVGGDGTNKPFGFRSSQITPAELAQAGATLAWDDLVKLTLKVNAAYRANAVFVVSTKALGLIMTLKDNAGRPIYLPSLTEGAPATLLGRPVYEVSEIPENLGTGTNETEVWFGDFKNYLIGDREATRIKFGTTGTDLESDKISLVIFKRVAGLPIMSESFAKLTKVK